MASAVDLSKSLQLFEGWPAEKPTVVWLLELCQSADYRTVALDALVQHLPKSPLSLLRQRIKAAVSKCVRVGGAVPLGEADHEPVDGSDPRHAPRLKALLRAQKNTPFRYEPVVTKAAQAARLPYEGHPSRLTVGEFAVGVGCFMASAISVGMQGAWMADSDPEALTVAKANCPSVPRGFGSIYDTDPTRLPWCNVLLGGACCQPFSRRGRQQGFNDDRAYTTLRMLHNVATVRPWFAVSENVENMLKVQGGAVWRIVRGVFEDLGYHVNPVRVCPTK